MTDVNIRPIDALASIPLDKIESNKLNPRKHLDDIADLAQSIDAQGLIQPLVVTAVPSRGTYRILAGHRRYAALVFLHRPTAMCVIRRGKTDVDTLVLMLVENGQRVNLTPLEEARAYQQLMDAKSWNQTQLGKAIGRSQASVSQRIMLLNLDEDTKAQLDAGDISVGEAYEQARHAAGTADTTRFTGWHFGKTHPLADAAGQLCTSLEHKPARRIGAGACGECWEAVIREDERRQLSTLDGAA